MSLPRSSSDRAMTTPGSASGRESAPSNTPSGSIFSTSTSPESSSRLVARQRDEILRLKDELARYRSREIEISALSVKVQQQFMATQNQIENLKSSVRSQLANPVTEKEYLLIENKPEHARDLLDTIKLGIYTQLGSLKASRDIAVTRASELSVRVDALTLDLEGARQSLEDAVRGRDSERANARRQASDLEAKEAEARELSGKLKDLEIRLSSLTVEKEQQLATHAQLQVKLAEVARLEILLKRADGEVARLKTQTECLEEKLDILKGEYYESKIQYEQKVLALESALRTAEEKIGVLRDVELESEVFIANVAAQEMDSSQRGATGSATANGVTSLGISSVPPSRRMQNALAVTKRCLAQENKIALLKAEIKDREDTIARLEASLGIARSALSAQSGGGVAAYEMIKDAVEKLIEEKQALRAQNEVLRDENNALTTQLRDAEGDLRVISSHREELMQIRRQLQQYAAGLADKSSTGSSGTVHFVQDREKSIRDQIWSGCGAAAGGARSDPRGVGSTGNRTNSGGGTGGSEKKEGEEQAMPLTANEHEMNTTFPPSPLGHGRVRDANLRNFTSPFAPYPGRENLAVPSSTAKNVPPAQQGFFSSSFGIGKIIEIS